jgi:hypothetical protein
MACCSGCASKDATGSGMCSTEKWVWGAIVAAFLLLVFIAIQ